MTLARYASVRSLLLCALLAVASLRSGAQQSEDPPAATQATAPPQSPAPIVRKTPKPAATDANGNPTAPPAVTTPRVPSARPLAKTPTAAGTATPAKTPLALQPAAPGPFNRAVIVLDPAHGAGDTGSRISDSLTEKDVTLALAFRLRSLLTARGFTVLMTRESDDTAVTPSGAPGNVLSLDDRAGIANHARPLACLLLHATASGAGVHLYSSELDPTPGEPASTPWLTAQAPWVTQSQRLASQLGTALQRAKIPLVNSRASVRPVDSLTCPALVLELAPNGTDPASLTDAGYQQRVAEVVAGAMVFWQNQAQPPPRLLSPAPPAPAPSAASPPPSGVQP